MESIGGGAFHGCAFTTIDLPSSLKKIGTAFQECHQLKSIVIPDGVTDLSDNTFAYCENLSSVELPVSITTIGHYAFYDCEALKQINFSENLEYIGEYAFQGCKSLKSIVIPEGVTVIRSHTFENCTNLSTVTLGSKMETIQGGAFANCRNLTDFYCYTDVVPEVSLDTFNDSYIDYATLHVPASAVEVYKAAEIWKEFGKIEAIEGTAIQQPKSHVTPTDAPVYNLQGQRLTDKPRKGVYIQNGKKVVMK